MNTLLKSILLYLLLSGLIITAFTKNVFYYYYQSKKANKNTSLFRTAVNMIGPKIIGALWIYPFKIKEESKDAIIEKLRIRFNNSSRVFLFFWAATIIWCLIYLR